MNTIVLELRNVFQPTDAKIDSLALRLNHLSDRLDKQNTRLDGAEQRISSLKDDSGMHMDK